MNGRGYLLCCFNLSVEMNGLSVGRCLFGMVIWVDFLFLERKCLVVEVILVEAVDAVQVGFMDLSRHGCLGYIMNVKVVMEAVVGVVGVVCGVRIGVAVDCVGTRAEGVVSNGGSVCVADGGGTGWKDCCRFSDWISRELWEDLPYCLPFMLNISEACLNISLEGRGG